MSSWSATRDGAYFAAPYVEVRLTAPDNIADAHHPPSTTDAADTSGAASPPSEHRGISPEDPGSMPRAEDDQSTFDNSPEFHDRPDPGPNVGREHI